MKKNQKQLSEIELMEASRIAKEKQDHIDELRKKARPSLLTRYFSGLLDFLFVVIGAVLFATFLAIPYTRMTNYSSYVANANEILYETGLYENSDDYLVKPDYDEKTYDQNIIHFYTNNSSAVLNNKLEEYNKAKSESGLYDGNYEKLESATDEEIEEFLTTQYDNAITFAKTDGSYIENMNKSFLVLFYGLLILITVSCSIFYLIIPMFRKEGETLSQIIFKLCIIDTEDFNQVKRWQIFVRFVIILFFDYLLPAVLYVRSFAGVMLLPILITVFVIGFSKTNSGPHDYASRSMVICKSRTNAVKLLESLRKETDETKMY